MGRKYLALVLSPVTDSGYLVAIKPSARRRSRAVGQWVNAHGSRRRFQSKPLARAWARSLSTPRTTLWIQDAIDDDEVDGFLVSGPRPESPTRHLDSQVSLTRF